MTISDNQITSLKGVLKRTSLKIPVINPGGNFTYNLNSDKDRYLDIQMVAVNLKTHLSEGELRVRMISSSNLLYNQVLEIRGRYIQMYSHGFTPLNIGEVVHPLSYSPDEVVELQRYIKDFAFADDDKNPFRILINNDTDKPTESDSVIEITYIERG